MELVTRVYEVGENWEVLVQLGKHRLAHFTEELDAVFNDGVRTGHPDDAHAWDARIHAAHSDRLAIHFPRPDVRTANSHREEGGRREANLSLTLLPVSLPHVRGNVVSVLQSGGTDQLEVLCLLVVGAYPHSVDERRRHPTVSNDLDDGAIASTKDWERLAA